MHGRSDETPAQAHGEIFELLATVGLPGALLAVAVGLVGLAGLSGWIGGARRVGTGDPLIAAAFGAAPLGAGARPGRLALAVRGRSRSRSSRCSPPAPPCWPATRPWAQRWTRLTGAALVVLAIVWVLPGLLSVRIEQQAVANADVGSAHTAATFNPFGTTALIAASSLEQARGDRAGALKDARDATDREPDNWATWIALARRAPARSGETPVRGPARPIRASPAARETGRGTRCLLASPCMSSSTAILADSHAIFRRGLRQLLEEAQINVAGEAENLPGLLSQLNEGSPQFVFVDAALADRAGLGVIRHNVADQTRLVFLVDAGIPAATLLSLMELGPAGCLERNQTPNGFSRSIEAIRRGEVALSRGPHPAPVRRDPVARRPPARRRAGPEAHPARARGAALREPGGPQPRHRRGPLDLRAHGQAARAEHPAEAGAADPGRSRDVLRAHARSPPRTATSTESGEHPLPTSTRGRPAERAGLCVCLGVRWSLADGRRVPAEAAERDAGDDEDAADGQEERDVGAGERQVAAVVPGPRGRLVRERGLDAGDAAGTAVLGEQRAVQRGAQLGGGVVAVDVAVGGDITCTIARWCRRSRRRRCWRRSPRRALQPVRPGGERKDGALKRTPEAGMTMRLCTIGRTTGLRARRS